MKSQVVAVPNSINDALRAVEQLGRSRLLAEATCEVLKLLYLWGWNDGFVSLQSGDTRAAMGFEDEEEAVGVALAELERKGFVRVRDGVWGYAPVEILSLAAPASADHTGLAWWRYYQVEMADEADGN